VALALLFVCAVTAQNGNGDHSPAALVESAADAETDLDLDIDSDIEAIAATDAELEAELAMMEGTEEPKVEEEKKEDEKKDDGKKEDGKKEDAKLPDGLMEKALEGASKKVESGEDAEAAADETSNELAADAKDAENAA